jgi:hypothetical protein
MLYTLTLDGIPLGRVDLNGSPRATGALLSLPAFAATGTSGVARRLGLALRLLGSPRVRPQVVGRALAAALADTARFQDRLGLRDVRGASAAVIHIVVAAFPRDRWPVVVVELREQAAAIRSETLLPSGGPGDQSRPAA